MQNKGLIRFLAWAFALVCLFQLSFTFVTSRVQKNAEKEAKAYVESAEVRDAVAAKTTDATEQQIMLDSIQQRRETEILNGKAEEKIYLGYTYRQCQAREIGLGLDLKGGMNVILEVSMKDLVKLLADNTEDPLFNEALENAVKAQKTSVNKDFVTLFYEEITALDKNVKLASYFGSNKDLPNIGLNSSNDDIVKAIREQATSAYENTYQVITQRIDRFGVAQPTIQKLAASERILVELPGVKDPERVRTLLQGTAQLEFWAVYENDEVMQNLYDADKILAAIYMNKGTEADSTADSTAVAEENEMDRMSNVDAAEHPLLSMLQLNAGGGKSPYIAFAKGADRDSIDRMLARAAEKKAFDTRRVKFLWSRKPENEKENIYVLYAMKVMSRDGVKPLLDGEFISDARQDFTSTGENEVSMTMTREGAIKWKKITGDNVGKCIAIVLDDQVCSAPVVNDEISGGRSSITGHFTLEEAKDLANILKSGKLPAPAHILQEAVVGPSLGKDSVRNGLISFILAFIVVLIYMVVFYNRAGWVSVGALIINVFLLIGVLASIGAVLTLPGIAGIVLTMAMAVDGNVIIYERIKEELRAGSSMANAVTNGFKNAYSAIIDGQLTTFLLGLVLILFGSGAVQGFAVTLCIGIATSLFTSIFITRLFIDSALDHKRAMNFSFPFSENFLRNAHVDFLGKRKTFYIIACIAIVICGVSFGVNKLNPGIDFSGGRTYVVDFDQPVKAVAVRADLEKQFGEAPEVKTYGRSNRLRITIKNNEEGDSIKNVIAEQMYIGVKPHFKNEISLEDFKSTEKNKYGIIQADQVGSTIAHDNLVHSIWAVIGGLVVMFIYIGLRFRSWRFGVGSVVALTHDTILVIGLFSLLYKIMPFNLQVDQYFISAVLTVIGYSINATVVIFDRVRENRKLYPKRDLKTQMNDAINATLARTVNTSGTTFVTLLMMFIFGGEVIRGFIFALLSGVVVGVFSSLCIACAIVYEISGKEKVKELD